MGTIQGGISGVTAIGRRVIALVAIALLTFTAASCAKPVQPTELISEPTPQPNRLTGQIAEVSPPATLETLKQIIDAYTPQVRLLSPRPGEVLSDTTATVRLQVRGLPLFKNDDWQLGPHLHLFLDNEPYRAVYDLSEPITFEDLTPGTHTLRVFASRPWHESFKNQGAFDQRTFHVIAPTPQNELDTSAPLLTYSRPQSTYGAEPIMLDFYLTNAPLHMSAQAEASDDLHDWRIRCTVNDQSFVFDQWQPIWLKGFKPGRNWVQLELIDEAGNPIDNRFNNTVRIIDYQPGGSDTLSRLVRGELDIKDLAGIIDPTYVPPAPPEPLAEPEAAPEPENPAAENSEAEDSAPENAESDAPAQKSAPSQAPPKSQPESPEPEAAESEDRIAPPELIDPLGLNDPVEPNRFVQPEVPPAIEAPAIEAPANLPENLPEAAPEDSGAIAPESDLPNTSGESIDVPDSPTAEDALRDGGDDLELPEDLVIPPVLVEPNTEPHITPHITIEALPEPEPLQPQPLDSPDELPIKDPTARGLLGRFKQWRGQPEAIPVPEDFSSRPQAAPEDFPRPDPQPPAEKTAPQPPKAKPGESESAVPIEPAPQAQQDIPDRETADKGPETQQPVEQPQGEPSRPTPQRPETSPRGPLPLAPEVRPFI